MPGPLPRPPYAELHLHLEGAIQPDTLRDLSPGITDQEIQSRFAFTDFAGFLQAYIWTLKLLRKPEDYALITRRLLDDLASQNICYAEITFSAGVVLWSGQNLEETYAAMREASLGHAVKAYWIPDAVRHFGPEPAAQVAEFAARHVNNGVIAFGIGGDELRGPASWFKEIYGDAKAAGLRLTAHAGETGGPDSVRGALEIGSERIGHGVRAVDDVGLMRELAERRIPLEVCITSNVRTGVAASAAAHPVRRLYDAGVVITLNTDDPAIFGTTLAGEYEIAARELGFSGSELEEIRLNAFRYAFDAKAAQGSLSRAR